MGEDLFAALRALIERAECADDAAGQAAALAELQRASGTALRDAVRQARDGGVPWRALAADLQIAVTTLRDQVVAGRAVRARSERHVLPGPLLDAFVGRQHEVGALRELVGHKRLVTLVGTGGIGKTRLAAEFTHRFADNFDRVWWVELGPLAPGSEVDGAVAAVLDGDPVVRQSGSALLVLDNCEHVLDGCARLLSELLKHSELVVLATSREPLGVAGEQTVPVGPLPLDLAVALFAERAQAADHRFELDGPLAEELCVRLDGMPLAIELAARQLAVLSPEMLSSFLDSRLTLLSGGPRTALPRQQSLLATIRWSYDLLSPVEQAVFRRLAIFVAGFDRADSEAMCADLGLVAAELWDAVSALVAKSLLMVDDGRFRVLESLRLFGIAELEHCDEWAPAVERFVAWMGTLAPNLPLPEGESRLHRRNRRARHWHNLEYALVVAPCRDDLSYAGVVTALTHTSRQALAGRTYRSLLEDAMARQKTPTGRLLLTIAMAADRICDGEYETARSLAAQAGAEAGDPWLEHAALLAEMVACGRMRDEESVNRLLPRLAAGARAMGDPFIIAGAQVEIGYELLQRGRLDEADEAIQEGLTHAPALWVSMVLCDLLTTAGTIALERGDTERAAAYFGLTMTIDEPHGRVDALQGMAMTVHAEQPELALRLFGATGATPAKNSDVGSPWWNQRCAAALSAAASAVGERADVLLAQGAELTLDQAVALALVEPEALTEREAEVAALVADGLTNQEIAARLGVSARTVATHVRNIRAKLDPTAPR